MNILFVNIDDDEWVAYDCYTARVADSELSTDCIQRRRHAHQACVDVNAKWPCSGASGGCDQMKGREL